MIARPRFTCPRCHRTIAATTTRPDPSPWGLIWRLRPHRNLGDWCVATELDHLVYADREEPSP